MLLLDIVDGMAVTVVLNRRVYVQVLSLIVTGDDWERLQDRGRNAFGIQQLARLRRVDVRGGGGAPVRAADYVIVPVLTIAQALDQRGCIPAVAAHGLNITVELVHQRRYR